MRTYDNAIGWKNIETGESGFLPFEGSRTEAVEYAKKLNYLYGSINHWVERKVL